MLLTIKQLQVKYGNHTALQIQTPISFEKGERIGIIGSNGAGKTTLVKTLLGMVNYEGSIVTNLAPEEMAAHMQRFTIIMIMLQDAALTFYDEVTSGLDFETRQKLMEKLVEWYRDKDDTLMMVSHYYEELEQLADKILILDEGKVIAYGKKEELFQTYCGNAIFILENDERNSRLSEGFVHLAAPGQRVKDAVCA